MQVFKLYLQVAKKRKGPMITYMLIFFIAFLIFSFAFNQDNSNTSFEAVKVETAILDEDHSQLSEQLVSYLGEHVNLIDVGDTKESLLDALFYGQVSYVLEIPKGFESSFLSENHTVKLISQQRPDDSSAALTQRYVDSYLNAIHSYHAVDSSKSLEELHELASKDSKQSTEITLMENNEEISKSVIQRNSYFNYLAYMFLAIIILMVGTIMSSINQQNVRKRILSSPLSLTSFNIQILLANLCFTLFVWAVFMAAVYIITPGMFTVVGALYTLNSLIFILVCLSAGVLISTLLSNRKNVNDALSGITNIIALGSCFTCGAFVPQSMLSGSLLTFASFNPTYWYVKGNDTLSTLTNSNWDSVMPILQGMGIMAVFAATFVILTLVVSKNKRTVQEFS